MTQCINKSKLIDHLSLLKKFDGQIFIRQFSSYPSEEEAYRIAKQFWKAGAAVRVTCFENRKWYVWVKK